jgi:hypothetical protein
MADFLTTLLANALKQESELVVVKLSVFLILFFLNSMQSSAAPDVLPESNDETDEDQPQRPKKKPTSVVHLSDHLVKKLLKIAGEALKKCEQSFALA